MITVELLALEDNQIVARNITIGETKEFELQTPDQPVMLPPEMHGTQLGVFLCTPDRLQCIELLPEEYDISNNVLRLQNAMLLRRVSFVPRMRLIICNPRPLELQIKRANNEYYFAVLLRAVGEVLTDVIARPVVAFPELEKHIRCGFVDDAGNVLSELRIPILDERGTSLLLQVRVSDQLFELLSPGDYPAIDIELEYY